MATSTPWTSLKHHSEIHELLETASLYLHIPFCHTRCHYCDFNTYAGILPLREPYVQALLREITLAGHSAKLSIEEPPTDGRREPRQAPPPRSSLPQPLQAAL